MKIASHFGGVVTLVLLALLHKDLNAGQVITFWVAVHMITTCIVQWVIDTIKKCRDAWQSNHGVNG